MNEFIQSSHFKNPYVQSDIMGTLKVWRDWLGWDYGSYYYDHDHLIGSNPMSYENFQFYFKDRLDRKEESVQRWALSSIYRLTNN